MTDDVTSDSKLFRVSVAAIPGKLTNRTKPCS